MAGVSALAATPRRSRTHATIPRVSFAGPPPRRRATEATLGAHLAFEGPHGRRSAATTQGVAGAVVALVVVGAVGMWVGGVNRLYAEPPRHGWPWDVAIGNVNFKMVPATLSRLSTDRRLSEMTEAAFGQVALNGVSAEVFAFDPSGTAPPEGAGGRNPTASDEMLWGARRAPARPRDR